MKKHRKPFAAAALIAVLLAVPLAAAAQIAGTWVGKTEVPGVGPDEITLVLKEANGSVTGTISDAAGSITSATEIKDVKWAGTELSYSFALPDGAKVTVTSRLEDGKLNGSWTHEQGSTGTFVMEKKKD